MRWVVTRSNRSGNDLLLGSSVKLGPVLDGHDRVPRMNVVEMMVWINPLALCIVHDKMNIGGHPFWLDGTEINTENIGRRELVTHFDGPNARARANVEDIVQGAFLDGRKKKSVLTQQFDAVVLHVLAVLLGFVVWEIVLPFPKTMVTAAIFIKVVPNTAR